MSKKYFTKKGVEVKIGGTCVLTSKVTKEFGEIRKTEYVKVTPESIPYLIAKGAIVAKEELPKDLEYYIKKVANHLGVKIDGARDFFRAVVMLNEGAALSIILKKVAIDLDKKYPDHISQSPEIYTIFTLDGRISKTNKAQIRSYKNFAAFRTLEDAKEACRIVAPILKHMFSENVEGK